VIHAAAGAVAITGLGIPATRIALVIRSLRLDCNPLEALVATGLDARGVLNRLDAAIRLDRTEVPVGGTGHFLDVQVTAALAAALAGGERAVVEGELEGLGFGCHKKRVTDRRN